MNKLFYPKLAASNIRKNGRVYFPFIITGAATTAMFFIMISIALNKGLDVMSGSYILKTILIFGTIVIGIFSALFIFYTNSFLIKQRKMELGLYNILGMEKKHMAKLLFYETFYNMLMSLTAGLLFGILMNKLMFLILLKLLAFPVKLSFYVSPAAVLITVALFAAIFFLALLFNMLQISLVRPAELLKGGQTGETEPKTKRLMTAAGLLFLAAGYYIALATEDPIAAIGLFFLAALSVIAGTYLLFTTGSVAFLKMLRANKSYYYKTEHFTAVSGMIYRMKQNAVGLANICILSTGVLLTLSATVSMYVGTDDALDFRYPYDMSITYYGSDDSSCNSIYSLAVSEAEKYGLKFNNEVHYTYRIFTAVKDNDKFDFDGEKIRQQSNKANSLYFITLSDYNRITGRGVTLKDDEAIIYSGSDKFGYGSALINGRTYRIYDEPDNMNCKWYLVNYAYYIVINDSEASSELIDSIYQAKGKDPGGLSYSMITNIEGDKKQIIDYSKALIEKFSNNNYDTNVDCKQLSEEEFYYVYGGLFFLGIFLGALFLMATVLIIYYKQLSEGYSDKKRFDILQKVGMSPDEIRKTVKKQILMVFFIPLAAAVVNIAFAFKMITKLLYIFNLTNVMLFFVFTVITVLVFGLIYTVVYLMTAKTYYKIVK